MIAGIDEAKKAATTIAAQLGLPAIPAAELEMIGEAVVGLIGVLGKQAVERARAAAQAAADKVVTMDDAKGVLGR